MAEVWKPADREHWVDEAIRRGWLSRDFPYEADFPTARPPRPRNPRIVTFKDWLESRGVVLDPYVSGFDQYHVNADGLIRE